MDETKGGQKIVSKNGMTTCACGAGCNCGCGCCGGHGHRVLWWILVIVILGVVFCIGVKAGEFREDLRSMFGGYYRGYPVMQYRGGYGGGGVAVPATGAASPAGSATGTPTGL